MAALQQFWHLPEKERQQKGADMRPININVGHYDYAVVTLFYVKLPQPIPQPKAVTRLPISWEDNILSVPPAQHSGFCPVKAK